MSSQDGAQALSAISRRWAGDRWIGPLLAAPHGVVLILDVEAGLVVYASSTASELRAAIAGPDGRLDSALDLPAQLRRAGPGLERPALARIQFDRRRIQPPVTCVMARATPGAMAALVITGRAPRLRAMAGTSPAAPIPVPSTDPVPAPDLPPDADGPVRFTWRSDGEDRIGAVSGPAGALVEAAMVGRSWPDLARARILTDADGLLAALASRRTFRAICLVLRRPGSAQSLDLEVSGAPLARAGQPFAGYGGFGLLRPLPPESTDMDEDATTPVRLEPDAPGPAAADPIEAECDSFAPAPAGPVLAAALSEDAGDTRLSGDEHDAFREIARALGARFAADGPVRVPQVHDGPGGDVMPFPMPALRATEPGPDATVPVRAEAAAVAILDALPAGILVARGEAVLFANARLLAMAGAETMSDVAGPGSLSRLFHGLSPAELSGSEAAALLSRRGNASIAIAVARAPIAWEGAAADLLIVREATAAPRDAAAAAARVAQDFAGRRAAEATAILDSLDEGILAVEAGGRIMSLNRRVATLFGLDPREVVGAGLTALFTPESASTILAALSAPGPAASSAPIAVTARGADGLIPVSLSLRPADGPARQSVLVLREGRPAPQGDSLAGQSRRTAAVAGALRSGLLARIGHDIRPRLSEIRDAADTLLASGAGALTTERERASLAGIRDSAEHVHAVVTDLLDLSVIEAGRRDLAFTDVALNGIVSDCVALMQPQAARDRIVIRTSFSDTLTPLVADEGSVRQAVLNVIANAIRFTEAGGQVIVSTTMADRGEVALRVRDTGIGMTPAEMETALDPHGMAADGAPPRAAGLPHKGGTGLGLPLTKALVEANRGRLRITSRKDEGTLVEMLFSAAQAMSA